MSDNQKISSDKNEPQKKAVVMNFPSEGFVCIHRRILDHAVAKNPEWAWRFVELLLLARNHDGEKKYNGKLRGHVYLSQTRLAERWRKSRWWVSAFLKFLEDELVVKCTFTNGLGDIEIINYDVWNPPFECQFSWQKQPGSGSTPAAPECHNDTPEKPAQRVKDKEECCSSPPASILSSVPTLLQVSEFCRTFQNLKRGITSIPSAWVERWYNYRIKKDRFPKEWREAIQERFLEDWDGNDGLAHWQPKTAGNKNAQQPAREVGELCHLIGLNKSQTPRTAGLDAELAQLEAELQKATGWGS